MRKILNVFICAVLLVVMSVSMTACCSNSIKNQIDSFQSQLAQQQELLQQLKEFSEQQLEKNRQLELENSALWESIEKMQVSIERLENNGPCHVKTIAKSNWVWGNIESVYLIYSQVQMEKFLNDLDVGFETSGELPWSLRGDDGSVVNKDFFNAAAANLEEKALVVSIFVSPCVPAIVTRHYLWKNNDTLHVEIDYTYGNATAVETVMVIMEVDRSWIGEVEKIELSLNK